MLTSKRTRIKFSIHDFTSNFKNVHWSKFEGIALAARVSTYGQQIVGIITLKFPLGPSSLIGCIGHIELIYHIKY